MKNQYIISALGAMLMASCADEFDRQFEVGRPDMIEEYAYLSDYKALKEYVGDPNFHLGIGTDAADYANQGAAFVITNANFTETVAGNAMKMGSVVDDNGVMNFGTVESYVGEAAKAGINIFGHTLAWHSQQPVKWLNKLIADKPLPAQPGGGQEVEDYYKDLTEFSSFPYYVMGYTPNFSKTEGLISESPGSWYQYFIATGIPTDPEKDYTYKMTCEVKSDKSGDVGVQMRWSWGEDPAAATLKVKEGDWQLISCEFSGVKGSSCDIIFQPGGFDGRFCVKNIKVSHVDKNAGPVKYWESIIANGDMEGTDAKNFASKSDQGAIGYQITDGVGKNGSRGVHITSKGGYDDAWESQFWIVSNTSLQEGDKIHVKFDYKADGGCAGTDVGTQAHVNPGVYQHYECIGTINFTDSWQTYDKQFVVDSKMAGNEGMKSIAFNMSPNKTPGSYYIDNVVLEIEKENIGGIPQTAEEKRDTLLYAMDKWIHGMMDACRDEEGNLLVKAWDVVNEPIGADGQLQHGKADDTQNFFWQDYLGDLDYVRTVVKLARQYGGDDLKLFVNDYNLEYDWDASGNKKLESLINWINQWESDGVTKIDGIGTQMHLSCYADPAEAEKRKQLIINSFKMMAATGKLVRISELDMGYVDADDKVVKTVDMTEEQHHQMADFYKWIIEQYKANIPAAQQWGITFWCATDAPADSGWRPGEPVGIWDQNYYRKHVYAGITDGLSDK